MTLLADDSSCHTDQNWCNFDYWQFGWLPKSDQILCAFLGAAITEFFMYDRFLQFSGKKINKIPAFTRHTLFIAKMAKGVSYTQENSVNK